MINEMELACLKLVAEGISADKISDQLDLEPGQVQDLLQSARQRLGAKNIFAAVIKTIRLGEIQIE